MEKRIIETLSFDFVAFNCGINSSATTFLVASLSSIFFLTLIGTNLAVILLSASGNTFHYIDTDSETLGISSIPSGVSPIIETLSIKGVCECGDRYVFAVDTNATTLHVVTAGDFGVADYEYEDTGIDSAVPTDIACSWGTESIFVSVKISDYEYGVVQKVDDIWDLQEVDYPVLKLQSGQDEVIGIIQGENNFVLKIGATKSNAYRVIFESSDMTKGTVRVNGFSSSFTDTISVTVNGASIYMTNHDANSAIAENKTGYKFSRWTRNGSPISSGGIIGSNIISACNSKAQLKYSLFGPFGKVT